MVIVKGIGGVFIDSHQAPTLAAWYAEILGIEFEPHLNGTGYYHVFFTRDVETPVVRENPVFAINQVETAPTASERGFVINLRVDNLYQVMEPLRARGNEIEEKILEWERGKHAWIRDLDGNRIDLYEEIFPA